MTRTRPIPRGNIRLLTERSWFDVPLIYANQGRATIAIEKGAPGERAFKEAFATWEGTATSVRPEPVTPNGGGYLVQVSSQKNEADAYASYRALQNNFPSALGPRAPLIKRVDLGDKGVFYRAMVGPFSTTEEAALFCGSLKSLGAQCLVQKN